jgi:hypothetical protein
VPNTAFIKGDSKQISRYYEILPSSDRLARLAIEFSQVIDLSDVQLQGGFLVRA